jgi:PhzF family phenazine biosynthesis protein
MAFEGFLFSHLTAVLMGDPLPRYSLNRLSPDRNALTALSARIGCNGYYVFTFDSDDPAILTHGRMFAPAIGIDEDPVTGNASGPLGAYLIQHRLVRHNGESFSFRAQQGEAIQRQGVVHVQVKIAEGEPQTVQVGGDAVIVWSGELTGITVLT